jgi:glycosyltransferase involved in cell wall biosynthesis
MRAELEYLGFFEEPTGYGAAAEAHLRALRVAGARALSRNVTVTRQGIRWQILGEDAGLDSATPRLVHTPPCWYSALLRRGATHVGVCAWETDRLPLGWKEALDEMAELWVPSAFCRDILARCTRSPVEVVPHPVEARDVTRTQFPGIPDDAFCFCAIQEWSDRKNSDGLVRAFVRAFRGRRDVILALKLGFRVGSDRLAAQRMLATLTRGIGPWRAPAVYLIAEDLSASAMDRLYRRADAFVSLHRAEGFGLCMAEAMAAGRAVVATAYSGNLEFMDEGSAFLVGHRSVPVRQRLTQTWFDRSMRWAEPDQDEAVDALRACESSPGLRARIAAAGRERVVRQLAPARIGERMRARVAQLG